MKRSIASDLVKMLTARAPRDIADLCLEFVLGTSHAPAGALFKLEDGRPILFASLGITQGGLDWMQANYERLARSLEAKATAIVFQEHSLAPLFEDQTLKGIIYCEGTAIDEEAVIEVSGMLLEAMALDRGSAHGYPALDSYLERTPAEEIERRKILLLLGRHEWNIARVAREYGVTRATIYKKLTRGGMTLREIKELRGRSRGRLSGSTA